MDNEHEKSKICYQTLKIRDLRDFQNFCIFTESQFFVNNRWYT